MRAMRSDGRVPVGAVVGIGVVVALGLFVANFMGRDVKLCKRVLTGLIQGNHAVRQHIDWGHLTALDVDVGATYTQIQDAQKQAAYQHVFVQKFAEGFAQAKADASVFTGWRAQGNGTVAVDYPAKNKTLVLRLSESGKQVAGFSWQ